MIFPRYTHSMSNYCCLNHMSIANINDISYTWFLYIIIHYYPLLSIIIHYYPLLSIIIQYYPVLSSIIQYYPRYIHCISIFFNPTK